ncbi:MAG: MFS transporter [Anaerolineae bacterium]
MSSLTRLRTALALERNVLTLSGTVFLLVTSLFTWYLLLPLYFRDLGASDAQVGLAYSLLTASFSLLQFAGGLLADRFGRKGPIVLPTFVFVPLYFLAGAARSWLLLLIPLLLINSLSAIQYPAFMALIAESVPEGQRGMAFGAFEFAIGLATALGPGLGAALLPLVGLRPLIYGTALITLVCALARVVGLRETSHQPTSLDVGELRHHFDARLRWFLAAASLFALVYTLTLWGPFTALHAEDALHLSKPQINGLFALGGFAAMAASLLGGRFTDRYGGRQALLVGCLSHVITMLAWALSRGLWVGGALFVMANMGLQVGIVAYSTLLTRMAPDRARGVVVGVSGTVVGVTSGVAPAVGAYLRGAFGSAAPFWAALGLGVAMALSLRPIAGDS